MNRDHKALAESNRNQEYEASFQEVIRELEDFLEIPVRVHVLIGQRRVRVRDLLDFEPGYILDLKRSAGESLMIALEDVYFAKGEVTVIEDTFGVRITEINDPRKV